MQRKDLALRVLSTAAIMSIVTSIAAPAFADIYYIGNGSIDVETITSTDGKQQYVKVTQGNKTYTDTSDEIVIKDGTSEKNTTQIEESRIDGKKANVAVPDNERTDTQELETAGSADAAGESQPDPDDAFTLNETGEDSAQTPEGNNPTEDTTDDPTEPPKKDVVYEYAPADPNPEQQATKLAPTTFAAPTAKTQEVTLDDATVADPTTTAPAEGSAKKPTTNVIKVVNNWVGKAAKELKIRLSNVNIKAANEKQEAAMDVSGSGTTKLELDGQNVLDSSDVCYQAGLRKQGEGTLTITDETDDRGNKITATKSGTSGSLIAKGAGGNGAAGIGGSVAEGTKNITIEGHATVHAAGGGSGAGIGGGGIYGDTQSGDAENIIIQGYATVDAKGSGSAAGIGGGGNGGNAENIIIRGHSKVTATTLGGAAIGGGYGSTSGGSAKGIVIRDHATVVAKSDGGYWLGDSCAAIGAAGNKDKDTEAEVTIGTPGATAATEDVNVTASGLYGSAIGSGTKDTKVTIQGNATIRTASMRNSTAIGSNYGNVEVNIKDNVTIDTDNAPVNAEPNNAGSSIGGGDIRGDSNRKVVVNIDGGTNGKVKIGDKIRIFGKYGAISATEVNIGDNVLLKMRLWKSLDDDKYINVKGTEAAVGTRNNPAAGGLVNTIGDNTELWYYSKGWQQKIVHGKNVCTKNEINRQEPTCTEEGWVKYGCTYESDRHATAPEHIDEWTETIPALGHDWKDNGDANHICDRDHVTAAHTYGEWTTVKEATCTAAGQKQHTCTECGHVETEVIPATGHHWVDKGDGTHTCPDCGATEGQPFNTNSALELRVVDAEGMNQPFTVSQNGTLRTYTGAYDIATLTGDLDTLRYLQDHGAQTIRFVTNGQTSSFDINDLLAQGSGSEVFYLTHRGAEEPTLLLVEADRSDLVKD